MGKKDGPWAIGRWRYTPTVNNVEGRTGFFKAKKRRAKALNNGSKMRGYRKERGN